MRTSLLILALVFALPASAETITFNGVTSGQALGVSHNGGMSVYAGEMSVTIDGAMATAYCVDLDHFISSGATYDADVVSMPAGSPWCEINHVLSNHVPADSTEAAAVQGAIWKLLYADETLTLSDATVETLAAAWAEEAQGTCPAFCDDALDWTFTWTAGPGGLVQLDITLSRATVDGWAPVVGEQVQLGADQAWGWSDGEGITDDNGLVTAILDLSGGAGSATVWATVDGLSLYRIEPTTTVQQLLQVTDPCTFDETMSTFTGGVLGDPRTIGFWKHQLATALGRKPGHGQVSGETLAGWLPLEVFDTEVASLKQLHDLLWPQKATMQQRALQQCSATLLNLASGELDWFTSIDLDGDGLEDGLFWEFWDEAEAAYESGDFETAKDFCDVINNL